MYKTMLMRTLNNGRNIFRLSDRSIFDMTVALQKSKVFTANNSPFLETTKNLW